jgi:glycosyltransferase involved in cell wall biosynthesis
VTGASRARPDVVIPARDAEATLATTLDRAALRELRSLIVIDRGSTDGTAGVARDLGAVVLREPAGGYGAACLRALAHLERAARADPEVVAFAPGDARPRRHRSWRRLLAIRSPAGDAELVIGGRAGGAPAAIARSAGSSTRSTATASGGPGRSARSGSRPWSPWA